MSIKSNIVEILPQTGSVEKSHLNITKRSDGFDLVVGKMYDAPGITLDILMRLSELFGTTLIDVDDYSEEGCETCDYGSDYGHTINIRYPTKNVDEVEKLINQGGKIYA